MTDKPEQTTPPSYQPEGQTTETPEYREISPYELQEILEQHEKWLESDKYKKWKELSDNEKRKKAHFKDGRANLSLANLRSANLRKANLQGADLYRVDLDSAVLSKANLGNAILRRANLRQAKLRGAIFRESVLQDADFTNATGLLARQFAEANVSGATLPEDIAKFDGLGYVEEISKKAGKLFISMLLGCVYAWLTIGTTRDVRLLTNSASSPLPIIGTDIPIVGFYFAAPLLLLSLYVWLHLYLQRLWKGLSELPAIFPDGKPLDEKVYPWLLNGFVRSHVEMLKRTRPPLSRIEVGIAIFLTWWLVPLTILFLWGRFLTRHDWPITALHIVLFGLTAWVGITFYELAKATLRGDDFSGFSWKPFLKQVIGYQHKVVQIALGIIFVLSMGAIYSPYSWTPTVYSWVGFSPFADLEEEDISIKPSTWTGQKEKIKDEIPLVKGAKLQGANLRQANMKRVFLIKADLRRAQLQGANLGYAQLQGVNLEEAQLQGADLRVAQLQGADLRRAQLQGAELRVAQLRGANLEEAQLQGADLWVAQLQRANLRGATLEKANLRGANLRGAKHLTQAQLNQACVDEETILPEGLTRPKPCSKEKLPKK